MEEDHGIYVIDETDTLEKRTGIRYVLIDSSKLDPTLCDPSLKFSTAKRKLIVNIGYTFGF